MSQGQLHNLLIIESMCLAGILIAAGGIPAAVGITWNAIILVANITAPDKKIGAAVGKAVSPKTQFNTIIIAQFKGKGA